MDTTTDHFTPLALRVRGNYNNKYRSAQRANSDTGISKEEKIIRAQAFVELVSHIESIVENGIFIFKLSELHSLYVGYLHDLGVDKTIYKTRLKVQLLDYFFGDCQEQYDGKSVIVVFNEGLKKLLKESVDAQDYKSQMLVIAKVVKFLRRETLSLKSSPYKGTSHLNVKISLCLLPSIFLYLCYLMGTKRMNKMIYHKLHLPYHSLYTSIQEVPLQL